MKKSAYLLGTSALAFFAVLACSTPGKKPTEAPLAKPPLVFTSRSSGKPDNLTHEEAMIRARQVAQVTYGLWFALDDVNDDFEGRAVVNFELKKAKEKLDLPKSIFLDFEEGTIRSISINGVKVTNPTDPERYDGHRIHFHTQELASSGSNRIEISFSHAYGKSGNGLHRFKDPADGKVYVYSDFEPFNAHKMFPCFDQPDMKASFELTVEAPDDWEVISATQERDVVTVDGRRSWAFPPTPLISTYVFPLHAGPFHYWKSEAEGIPLRLFARQSLAQYVDFQEWFKVTTQGLDFFNTRFGYPYPYSKYDQVLVPDFNHGAMENVAAVTFSERFVYRTPPTRDDRRDRADTILHEMAHMWFGNLVTMRWWNGLWLNESFASFAAAWAVEEATDFKGSWQNFNSSMKSWAYWEDQLVTTHPIEVPVMDTDQAEANFDGITYGKGAATLKQLRHFLGEDDFQEGLQRYFLKYALRNTTLNDFVKILGEASGKDLSHWQKTWLNTAGVNTVRADWGCDDEGRINRFVLKQAPPEGSSELRPHRTEVALYASSGGALALKDTFDVTYADAETSVPEAIGKKCPALVFANHGDQDYAKIELDPVSLNTTRKHLGKISDPFVRQMLWHTLWEMVTDGKLAAQDYAEAAFSQLPKEKDSQVIGQVAETLFDRSIQRDSVERFLPAAIRAEYHPKLERFLRKQLEGAPAGSDLQILWFTKWVNAATTPASVEFASRLLSGKSKLAGFKIDQDRRWDLIFVLSRNGDSRSLELISAEAKKDPTDMGKNSAISAEAAIPEMFIKNRWLSRILAPIGGAPAEISTPKIIIPGVLAESTPPPSASPVSLEARASSTTGSPLPSPTSSLVTTEKTLSVSKLRHAARSFHDISRTDLVPNFVEVYFKTIPKLILSSDETYNRTFAGKMFPSLCDPSIVARTTQVLDENPNLPAQIKKTLLVHRQEEERCVRARAKASGSAAIQAN